MCKGNLFIDVPTNIDDDHAALEYFIINEAIVSKSKKSFSTNVFREAFRVFDREGHGFITVPDLIQVLTSLGDKLTQGNRDQMFFLNHMVDKFN
jgi:Ca2+-binding EF-hand superfamily protein